MSKKLWNYDTFEKLKNTKYLTIEATSPGKRKAARCEWVSEGIWNSKVSLFWMGSSGYV